MEEVWGKLVPRLGIILGELELMLSDDVGISVEYDESGRAVYKR